MPRQPHALMTWIVGIGLLASTFPVGLHPPSKPAGLRTALELLDKKSKPRHLTWTGLKFVSRS